MFQFQIVINIFIFAVSQQNDYIQMHWGKLVHQVFLILMLYCDRVEIDGSAYQGTLSNFIEYDLCY